jgi:hypothetical protein
MPSTGGTGNTARRAKGSTMKNRSNLPRSAGRPSLAAPDVTAILTTEPTYCAPPHWIGVNVGEPKAELGHFAVCRLLTQGSGFESVLQSHLFQFESSAQPVQPLVAVAS